ncbi:MAG TPA: DUF6785 family protein, partial [Abditibacteriaceae bacterium]
MRVVLLSLVLAALFGYLVPLIELKFSNTYLGGMHLPPGGVAVLMMLVLVVNPLLRFLSKYSATFFRPFSRDETLVVFITCLFSCLVPGQRSESSFVGATVAPFYYASPENRWLSFLETNLPNWFSPVLHNGRYDEAGKTLAAGWFFGSDGVIPWAIWLVPILAWSVLIVAIYVLHGCLSVMLRAQWSNREALAFPLLRVPLAMTEGMDEGRKGTVGKLFSNPLFWIAAGLTFFVQLMRGLHLYYPDVPDFPREIPTWPLQAGNPPWDQIGWTPIFFYPLAIAITYLLTAEIGFSLWAFAWFIKLQYVAAYYIGMPQATLPVVPTMGMPAFAEYQRIGAFVMFTAIMLWTGREHFFYICRRAFGRARSTTLEHQEPLSYPVAFWGFVISLAVCIGWSCAAGVRWDISLLMWGGYLVTALVLTRVVVEGGFLFVEHGLRSLGFIGQLFGSGTGAYLNAGSLVPGSFLHHAVMYDSRGMLLPSFIQSFKLAHDRGIRLRPLLALISASIFITLVMGIWMRVKLGYDHGGSTLNSSESAGAQDIARGASELINGAGGTSWSNWFWMMAGAGLFYGLMFMRSRYLWFALHPIGYITTLTWSIDQLWSSIFIGWSCKVLITKYGGITGYRAASPLFFGMALGDVISIMFWLFVDLWQGRTGHQLLPG